jgi:hypothetical protein
MAKRPERERERELEPNPVPPPAQAETASEGHDRGEEKISRYKPELIDFLLGVVLSPTSRAALHTKVIAANKLLDIGESFLNRAPYPGVRRAVYDASAEGDVSRSGK